MKVVSLLVVHKLAASAKGIESTCMVNRACSQRTTPFVTMSQAATCFTSFRGDEQSASALTLHHKGLM